MLYRQCRKKRFEMEFQVIKSLKSDKNTWYTYGQSISQIESSDTNALEEKGTTENQTLESFQAINFIMPIIA